MSRRCSFKNSNIVIFLKYRSFRKRYVERGAKEAPGINNMQEKIKNLIKDALKNLKIEDSDFVVEHPEDLKNGDYSTNVAMVLAKKLKTNPKELAEKITAVLKKAQTEFPEIEEIKVAGAGFINFHLSRKFFSKSIETIVNQAEYVGKNDTLSGKKIMIEYTDPNPFKPFHIGHLMTNA